jgi:hypothetical protein
MNVTKRADDELNLDVRLCNCAGCHKELLGDEYLTALRLKRWGDWPPLAFRMFQKGELVRAMLMVGSHLKPFCLRCVETGRHEDVRQRHLERFPGAGVVREVRSAVP